MRLRLDLPDEWLIIWASAAVLAALFAGYCLTRLLLGRARLREEEAHFKKLKDLRARLALDEPARWNTTP